MKINDFRIEIRSKGRKIESMFVLDKKIVENLRFPFLELTVEKVGADVRLSWQQLKASRRRQEARDYGESRRKGEEIFDTPCKVNFRVSLPPVSKNTKR